MRGRLVESPHSSSWQSLRFLEGNLIVSCQASAGEPLCAPEHILALSLSAIAGGAKGLRLEGTENIQHVRKHTELPIIGLIKSPGISGEERLRKVYITASYNEAEAIAGAGADIIAMDATGRVRPDGLSIGELISKVHTNLEKPVWADISTLADGIAASNAGADVISTTLYGYTEETRLPPEAGPNFKLLQELVEHIPQPVILEGRIWHPAEVRQAFELGAYACVVGSAITRPQLITKRFVKALPA